MLWDFLNYAGKIVSMEYPPMKFWLSYYLRYSHRLENPATEAL